MDDDLEQVLDLEELENRFNEESQSQGFAEGLEQGRKAGHDEGYSRGSEEGERIGTEIGTYRGYLMVWLQMMQPNSERPPSSTRLITRLNETLDLIEDFPKDNQMVCEPKLDEIRSKLKQITSILGLNMFDVFSQGLELSRQKSVI